MSVLPAEVHTALAQLLQGLQSTDNTARTAAEEQLNAEWVSQRPDLLLTGLAEQMQGANDDGVSCLPPDLALPLLHTVHDVSPMTLKCVQTD